MAGKTKAAVLQRLKKQHTPSTVVKTVFFFIQMNEYIINVEKFENEWKIPLQIAYLPSPLQKFTPSFCPSHPFYLKFSQPPPFKFSKIPNPPPFSREVPTI